jgi:hypothetical protein
MVSIKMAKKNVSKIFSDFQKNYSPNAVNDLSTLSTKDFAKKYFPGMKTKSALGKTRNLQQGAKLTTPRKQRVVTHLHKKTRIYQHQYTKNGQTTYWKTRETSYNSDDSQQFQFIEVRNDTTPSTNCIKNNQPSLELKFNQLPKKSMKYLYTKLFFSVQYEFYVLDKSTGLWKTYPGTFQESYAIYFVKNIKKAIDDIIDAMQKFFKYSESREYLIKSPLHFYEKVILK